MSRFLLSLLIAACLAGPSTLRADAGARVDTLLAGLKSLQSRFIQRHFDENGKLIEESTGVVFLHRPGRFRWDYAYPYHQLIVGDGSRVWIYDSELEQVTVREMGDAIGRTPAMLLTTDQPVSANFEVSALKTEGGVEWFSLVPRSEEATFATIRVALSADTLQAMELVDNFGQLTRIEFADQRRNVDIDPTLFTFTPPENADVIGDGPSR